MPAITLTISDSEGRKTYLTFMATKVTIESLTNQINRQNEYDLEDFPRLAISKAKFLVKDPVVLDDLELRERKRKQRHDRQP